MEKKYKLTDNVKNYNGRELYQIEAVKDFMYRGNLILTGDKGGYVETEDNLSHEGNCWIYDNAMVFDNAQIRGDARIKDNSLVYDNAIIYDDALIKDYAEISGNTTILNCACIYGRAKVSENAMIGGFVNVKDIAKVLGNSCLLGRIKVYDRAEVNIFDNDNKLTEEYYIGNNSVIKDYNRDIMFISNFGVSDRLSLSFTKQSDSSIDVTIPGVYNNNIDKFVDYIKTTYTTDFNDKDKDQIIEQAVSIIKYAKASMR